MTKQLRIGVVGTGWWVDTMHLPALKSHPQAEVVALCGRNRARAQPLADKFAIPHVYADYRQMVEEARLDAVVISSPDETHYEIAMAAFDAGLHVLCEKPLATNSALAKAMLARAEASGRKHMVFFTFRWLPHMRYLFELVDEGYLGAIYHGYFRWLLAYPPFLIDGWRARANGALADVGSHLVDMAHRTMGDIAQVNAQIRSWPQAMNAAGERFGPANDAATAMLQFASGAMGVIQVSSVAHTAGQWEGWQVLLHGEKGSLELSHTADGQLILWGARRGEARSMPLSAPAHLLTGLPPEQAENPKSEDVFTRQAVGSRLFVDAILQDLPVTPTFFEGFKVQQVIDAALESNRRGCWVAPATGAESSDNS